MKKLTELVHLREKLIQAYDAVPATNELEHLHAKISSIVSEREAIDHQTMLEELVNDIGQVRQRFETNQAQFNSAIDTLNHEIMAEGTKFFSDNYTLELRVESEATTVIRRVRVMELSTAVNDEILNRIQLYSTWKYPALEIGCRDGEWTPHLVANDPLYIVEHYREFLDSTMSRFNPDYQRRIRPYLIKDQDMSELPQGQMGFVFCWNYLNYRSLDTVKEYLKSVKDLLRPGGTFMFSYNNGDIPECAGYVDNGWMSYIPKSMLIPMCESLGYEIIFTRDIRGEGTSISWVEIRKPGTLETVKAHQVLGKIESITV
jgi:SAM-dependent methyltransferase